MVLVCKRSKHVFSFLQGFSIVKIVVVDGYPTALYGANLKFTKHFVHVVGLWKRLGLRGFGTSSFFFFLKMAPVALPRKN